MAGRFDAIKIIDQDLSIVEDMRGFYEASENAYSQTKVRPTIVKYRDVLYYQSVI